MLIDARTRLQAAWDACSSLPPIEFTDEEARAILSAAPASPIPTSVNGAEREGIIQSDRVAASWAYHSPGMVRPILEGRSDDLPFVKACAQYRRALSPALDNTAVEGQLREAGGILAKALETIASRKWNSKPDAVAIADTALLASQQVMTRAALTAETEKAR